MNLSSVGHRSPTAQGERMEKGVAETGDGEQEGKEDSKKVNWGNDDSGIGERKETDKGGMNRTCSRIWEV